MKPTFLISLGVLLSLSIAACGGAAEADDPTSPSPPPSAATTEPPPATPSPPAPPSTPETCEGGTYVADASRWQRAGTNPKGYAMTADPSRSYCEKPGAHVKSLESVSIEKFGTFMDSISAEDYRGKRIRLSGVVEAKDVTGWAGLWMRIDNAQQGRLAFDNMSKRPIVGTRAPKEHAVVLDVPDDAHVIAFGILLSGAGEVWTKQVVIEVVGTDVPTTGS